MNREITKTRWCPECTQAGRAVKLTYCGTQEIAPKRVQIVCFECPHGHRINERLPFEIAQDLIAKLTTT